MMLGITVLLALVSPRRRGDRVKRREFIAGLGGAAAWPLVARAQQPEKTRLVGILMGFADSSDPDGQIRLAAFRQALAALGWREGDNMSTDLRWGAGDVNRTASAAKELVGKRPDVILSHATLATHAVHRETSSIPVVFVSVPDPIGSGFVDSLPHPGGNMTGFLNLEATVAEKWLELLKEIAPRTARVGVMLIHKVPLTQSITLSHSRIWRRRLGSQYSPCTFGAMVTSIRRLEKWRAILEAV
jgi:putative tryptophan/tyrosine transport system substrate-binding protein